MAPIPPQILQLLLNQYRKLQFGQDKLLDLFELAM